MTGERDHGKVSFHAESGIAYLVFERPSARNAMTWEMYEQLSECLLRIQEDRTLRLAVLRGAGGSAFIAGTDIAQFTEFTSGADGVAYETRIDSYIAALEAVRVPTIAVVEGMAVGGGLAIANACDLRIATNGAHFGVPIARTLGNCLSIANIRRLIGTLGPSIVRRMLLSAELFRAEDLGPLGYLAAVVTPEELERTVQDICSGLLGHAPITISVTREMIRRLSQDPHAVADDLIRQCYGSEDFQSGVSAFLTKSKPQWRGC
ncbi:enoyl-CoA hydratase/isomerase family protein [Roseomonas gilardii]|uniref:enoyl-CoA hydratase/isomerase family protein n=1 Tax=Roseomonas gilardii TaxID=257708 RepID=UPI0011A7ECB9|nr:enoyl-CoA hydratase/isomerase family protein [Roseomonas gilardii]